MGTLFSFFFFMVELDQVLIEQGNLLYNYWNNSLRHDFLEFIYFVTVGSFTADGGLL